MQPRTFWSALRSVSLLKNHWGGFATPTQSKGGARHSEMGLIYEHIFHLVLGLPKDGELQAWRVRARS